MENKETVWEEFENIKPYVEKAAEQCFSCGIEPGLYNFPLCLFKKNTGIVIRKVLRTIKSDILRNVRSAKKK